LRWPDFKPAARQHIVAQLESDARDHQAIPELHERVITNPGLSPAWRSTRSSPEAPPHRAIVELSIPAFSSVIAAVCRRTCIVIRLDRSVEHLRSTTRTFFARRRSIASRVSGPPSREGKQWTCRIGVAFAHPDLEYSDGLGGERRDSFFSSFADRANVRAGAELRIAAG
jgi:hypothetical protein